MPILDQNYLGELEEYLKSGNFKEDFFYSPEERRIEMLTFLESLMDLGELADDVATRIIFRKKEGEE
jgi:hypothetical protein